MSFHLVLKNILKTISIQHPIRIQESYYINFSFPLYFFLILTKMNKNASIAFNSFLHSWNFRNFMKIYWIQETTHYNWTNTIPVNHKFLLWNNKENTFYATSECSYWKIHQLTALIASVLAVHRIKLFFTSYFTTWKVIWESCRSFLHC